MKKKIYLILIIMCLNLILLSSCNQNVMINEVDLTDNNLSNLEYLYVDIKGEVIFPGVYVIKSTSLIKDLIDMAGGLTSNADISKINLAQGLANNQMIIIPSVSSSNDSNNYESSLININIANKSELMTLPSIGEAKANNIIAYRTNKGLFKSIEEIKQVSGIGNEIYNKIKDYITI